jgi:putative zinc finger/helix-turn-helix YgiT family protein
MAIDGRCGSCGGEAVLGYDAQEFNYGPEANGVVLSAEVPVWTCQECGDQVMGEEAEGIMHDVVCAYLGRLNPREVRSIRSGFGMLQDDFAELTGYGTASIKRWEAGSQIQSESADKHLRLVRSLGAAEARKRTRAPSRPTFRMPDDPGKQEGARTFVLRRPGAPAVQADA